MSLKEELEKCYINGYEYVTHAVGNDMMIYFMYNCKLNKTKIIKYFKDGGCIKVEELDYNLFGRWENEKDFNINMFANDYNVFCM